MTRPSVFAWPLCVVALLATALLGAHCHGNESKQPAGPLGAQQQPAQLQGEQAAAPNEGLTEEETKKLLPGVDTAALTPKQRSDLVELAGDTFCPCASMTVAGCLRAGTACRPAQRLVELAKRMLAAGQSEPQALLRVETYYSSFPKERRKDVGTEGPTQGNPQAKVTIVEFSDFECPACRAAHPQLEELVKKYPNDVKWVFRFFPLPQHPHAYKAAQCGVYAHEKGKFWPLADQFFSHQDQLDDDGLKKWAGVVGLDGNAMLKAIEDPKYAARVDADKEAGTQLQIGGTPSLFINGRQYVLPPSLEYLSWTVEDELEWLSNGGKWAGQ